MTEEEVEEGFNEETIRRYPRSNRKISLAVCAYSLTNGDQESKAQTSFISPHGIVFQAKENYPEGTLLKIQVALPNYWNRKQRFVDYGRVDSPEKFRILAKVVKTEDLGKRGRRRQVLVQTVNMDATDEQVLKTFLQEG